VVWESAAVVVIQGAKTEVVCYSSFDGSFFLALACVALEELVVDAVFVEGGLRFEELAVDDAPGPDVGWLVDLVAEVDFGGAVYDGLDEAFGWLHDDS